MFVGGGASPAAASAPSAGGAAASPSAAGVASPSAAAASPSGAAGAASTLGTGFGVRSIGSQTAASEAARASMSAHLTGGSDVFGSSPSFA